MSLEADLAGAEWRARRNAYLVLAALLAATSGASFLVLSVVNGLEEGIGNELSQTLGGDVRVARGKTGLGDGDVMAGVFDVLAGLQAAEPRAYLAPRLETQAIFIQDGDFTASEQPSSRAAAVLVGLDPAADARVVGLDGLVTAGEGRAALLRAYRAPTGETLVPILVGEAFLETGNATVAGATFSWDSVYNFSAGQVENGGLVTARGIVVGTYATGFRMVDRLVVYAPRGEVARLLGHHPENPPANVVLVKTSDPDAVAAGATRLGFSTLDAPAFRESYLGPVFLGVRATAWTVAGLLALMTAGWVGYTLAHHVQADRAKIATLRAVGIPDRAIARTYLLVAAVLGGVGALVGVLAAALLSLGVGLLARGTGLPAPSPSLLEGVLLAVLSGLAALATCRLALRRAVRVSIRDALQAP
jgi:ABC-type lipoprotein release transport system permease subunit